MCSSLRVLRLTGAVNGKPDIITLSEFGSPLTNGRYLSYRCNQPKGVVIVSVMRIVSYAGKLLLLLAVLCYFTGAVVAFGPILQSTNSSSTGTPYLGYGRSVAISDLNGDRILDEAELAWNGLDKSISLKFAKNQQSSVLRFSTQGAWQGSLIARDIDNDGDIDLVWTDTVNPNDVVVWVNNGVGCFERAAPSTVSGLNLVLGGVNLAALPLVQLHLLAVNTKAPVVEPAPHSVFLSFIKPSLPDRYSSPLRLSAGNFLHLPERAPPSQA